MNGYWGLLVGIVLFLGSPVFVGLTIVFAVAYWRKRTPGLLIALVVSSIPSIAAGAEIVYLAILWKAAAKDAPAYRAAHLKVLTTATSVDGVELPAGSTVLRPLALGADTSVTLAKPAVIAGLPLRGTFEMAGGRIDEGVFLTRDTRVDGFSCSAAHEIFLYRGRLAACTLTDVDRVDGVPCSDIRGREPLSCRLGASYRVYGMTFPAGTIWSQRGRNDATVQLETRGPIILFNGTPADYFIRVHVRPQGLDAPGFVGQYRGCAFFTAHLSQDGTGSVAGRGCKIDVPRGTLTVGPQITL